MLYVLYVVSKIRTDLKPTQDERLPPKKGMTIPESHPVFSAHSEMLFAAIELLNNPRHLVKPIPVYISVRG